MFCVQLILAMAFVGVGRQTPFQHSLQSAAANPRHRRLRVSFSFSDTSTKPSMGDVSGIGRRRRVAIAGVQRTRSANDQIHIAGFATGFGEAPGQGVGRKGCGSETRIAATPVGAATGTTGALIFEHFRARLPAQSPAMAASKASRSTQ